PGTRPADGTRPARGAKPDDTKLVAALAAGLNLDAATVKAALAKLEAAHQAQHEARHAPPFAAIAKALSLDEAAVKAAFEANRPAAPAGR
ncbi:MAG: hypothetical protein JWO02_2597, partial [Solirubrobacterales bacterium]|nr:hypothetical protein [Solirubrobacterales bacterium]